MPIFQFHTRTLYNEVSVGHLSQQKAWPKINGTFTWIWNQSGSKSVQFFTVPSNHEWNKRELLNRSDVDFYTGLLRSGEMIVWGVRISHVGIKTSEKNKWGIYFAKSPMLRSCIWSLCRNKKMGDACDTMLSHM